jgi:hypothetical protein
MIDVMFLFPIGWLLAVAIPTIFERVPEFILQNYAFYVAFILWMM